LALVLTHKHYTRLEKLAREKHSSFLQKSVNYGQKSFINLAPDCEEKATKIEEFLVLCGGKTFGSN
jgi:hypothetical protein